MGFSAKFRDQAVGMLMPMRPVMARSMFGGCGLFLDGIMLGLIVDRTLYLKVDAGNLARFEAEGCAPFSYETEDGRNVVMSYREAPVHAMMNPDELCAWAENALAAARRSHTKTSKRIRPAPER
ncbi:MAG: TfoX/Sxy family protein [Alphaproteobacteria bacterium]|nr:TfoX/Sxy family protein [Alphaproteobacteria bacterium]